MNDVQKFNEYLQTKDCDTDVLMNRFYFTSYLKHLQKEEAKLNTINKKITSLKVYNDWLFQNSMVDEVFVVRIKKDKIRIAAGSKVEVTVLTEGQMRIPSR